MHVILGSASKSRKRILERRNYNFKIITADIDEKAIRFEDSKRLVLALANAKADAILPRINESVLLITADQVVVCNGKIREKPESEEEAREFLRSYCKYPAECVNGVSVTNTLTGKRVIQLDVSKVYFRVIPDGIINKLIEEGDVFYRAGGFSAENPLLKSYISKIKGSLDSVEGLPIELVEQMMREAQAYQNYV